MNIRKITVTAVLSSLALLSFMLENILPPLFLPGARLGVSNIFILIALLFLGKRYAIIVLVVKVGLGSVFSGNVSAILYSFPSGLVALIIEMILVRYLNKFSVVAISVTGAVFNITLQNTVFCLVTGTFNYMIYTPYLALIGILGGLFVGLVVYLLTITIPENTYVKIFDLKE